MSEQSAAVVAELQRIAASNGGILQPCAVVEAARPADSILHERFEWDDTEAAEQYRLWQARQLIRCSVVIEPRTETTVRAFVSLTADREADGGGYRETVRVMARADSRAALLADALAELEVFQRKYAALTELAAVFAAVRAVIKRKAP